MFAPGTHLQNITGQIIRRALLGVNVHVYMCVHTHTGVCCRLRLGEEFRVSAKEPGADTAGILLRSHPPLYQFPLAAVKIITPLWLRTTDACSLIVLEAGVQSHWTEN